jgi:hypothetical protein
MRCANGSSVNSSVGPPAVQIHRSAARRRLEDGHVEYLGATRRDRAPVFILKDGGPAAGCRRICFVDEFGLHRRVCARRKHVERVARKVLGIVQRIGAFQKQDRVPLRLSDLRESGEEHVEPGTSAPERSPLRLCVFKMRYSATPNTNLRLERGALKSGRSGRIV